MTASSPESKLLELIRKKDRSGHPARSWVLVLQSVADQARALALWATDDPLGAARGLFMGLAALTLVWGLWGLWGSSADQGLSDDRLVSLGSMSVGPVSTESRPLSYYADVINRRNLFRSLKVETPKPSPVEPPAPVVLAPPPGPTLAQLAADLSLVGIVNAGELQAIIVSKRAQKTHYVTSGQMIGDILVQKVYENRVTLSRENETFDLSL